MGSGGFILYPLWKSLSLSPTSPSIYNEQINYGSKLSWRTQLGLLKERNEMAALHY
jgi:hypothetical protein